MGSNFTLTLPLLAEDGDALTSTASPEFEHNGTGLRVLIVDDNRDAGAMLGYMLEAAGHVVQVEEDAVSAIRTSRESDFEVFILDIGLPDVDGYELARRLRADVGTAGTTIIAMTGYGQPQDRVLSNAAGFDHHFVKPADQQELLRLLSNLAVQIRGNSIN